MNTPTPTRYELERVLIAEHGVNAMYLGASSMSTTFREALERGLITREQYDDAHRRAGRSWNYCGD